MPSCSLQAVATGKTVAAVAVSAIGAIQSAHAQSAAASYQAQIAEDQQTIQEQQAQQTAAAGEAVTEQQGMKNRANLGTIVAAQGASGMDVNTGGASQMRLCAGECGQLVGMTIRSDYARQTYGYQGGAVVSGNQAGLYRAEATEAPIGGAFDAAGPLLSGMSSAGSQYVGGSKRAAVEPWSTDDANTASRRDSRGVSPPPSASRYARRSRAPRRNGARAPDATWRGGSAPSLRRRATFAAIHEDMETNRI